MNQEKAIELLNNSENIKLSSLSPFITEILNAKECDNNTICFVISAGILGLANALTERAPEGNLDGQQKMSIFFEFARRWLDIESPMRLVDYECLLFPNQEILFTTITKETWNWTRKRAISFVAEIAAKEPKTEEDKKTFDHLTKIIDGVVPFGLTVKG